LETKRIERSNVINSERKVNLVNGMNFTAKLMALQEITQDARVVVIDPEQKYNCLAALFNNR
jgi:hypothetical protein